MVFKEDVCGKAALCLGSAGGEDGRVLQMSLWQERRMGWWCGCLCWRSGVHALAAVGFSPCLFPLELSASSVSNVLCIGVEESGIKQHHVGC